MVRLLFVSGGIMVLGLIAVFASIVYKMNERAQEFFKKMAEMAPQPQAKAAGAGA